MSDDTSAKGGPNFARFSSVPVEIVVSVGMARPTLEELLALNDEGVLPLDRKIDEPVELLVGDVLIARGELEEIGGEGSGKIGVRITEVLAEAGDL